MLFITGGAALTKPWVYQLLLCESPYDNYNIDYVCKTGSVGYVRKKKRARVELVVE